MHRHYTAIGKLTNPLTLTEYNGIITASQTSSVIDSFRWSTQSDYGKNISKRINSQPQSVPNQEIRK